MSKTKNFFNTPLNLLPQYFKKIGLGLIILCMLVPVAFKVFHFQIAPIKKEIIQIILRDIFLISLVFVAFSKDRIEDELTLMLRMKAIVSSLFIGFTSIIVRDLTNLVLNESLPDIILSSYRSIIQILIWIIIFNRIFAKLNR